jgi:uncharacterized protein Smg (DUF494 family)
MNIISFIIKEVLEGKDLLETETEIVESLMDQGYSLEEINSAFDWLFSLVTKGMTKKRIKPTTSKRVLHHLERLKLNSQAYGLLIRMQESGLITPAQQEEIIEQALTSNEEVGLEEMKRIAGQVVFSNPFYKWGGNLE